MNVPAAAAGLALTALLGVRQRALRCRASKVL